jgi:hypothetical protein
MDTSAQAPLQELLILVKNIDKNFSQFKEDMKNQMKDIFERLDAIEQDKSLSNIKVRNNEQVNNVLDGKLK